MTAHRWPTVVGAGTAIVLVLAGVGWVIASGPAAVFPSFDAALSEGPSAPSVQTQPGESSAIPDPQAATRIPSPTGTVAPATPTGPASPAAPATPATPADPIAPAPVPEAPPGDPHAPGGIAAVACVSSDMADIITFEPAAGGGDVSGYRLLAAPNADGAFTVVADAPVEARSFARAVTETGSVFYTVAAYGPGGDGPVSNVVSNAQVLMSTDVPPEGRTLRSSNGEVILVMPAGSFAETTTVSVSEVAGSATGAIISLAGVYDITPSGSLGAPATLSVAYRLAVTHHQVSAALLRAAGLVTYDGASGEWVTGATNVRTEGGYLSGELDHFSYWTGVTIQPHGTSAAEVGYCSGVCHDLDTYPGSTTRYDSRDPQICYNCHGRDGTIELPPGSTSSPPAGASGPNIQAEFFAVTGQTRPPAASTHPVAIGDLYCTACHDPHASRAASPGLLKAWNPLTGGYVQGSGGMSPGTEFCWTCHGAARNRRIDYIVPGYFTRTGGDKKTRFTGGAHSAGAASTQRLDTEPELERGVATRVQVNTDGTVDLPTSIVQMPKLTTTTASPAPTFRYPTTGGDRVTYDSDPNTSIYWNAAAVGATAGNSWLGSGSVTVDLGGLTRVESFTYAAISSANAGDVLQIQVSTDGASWSNLVSQGTLGTRLPASVTLNGSADARFVRFALQRDFSANPTGQMYVNELTVQGRPLQGTFELRVDIPRKATYVGGVVRWQASTPASTAAVVSARGSLDNGLTWTPWRPVSNGSALTDIPAGSNLDAALLEVSVALSTSVLGQTPSLDWVEVTTTRGAIAGSPPAWTGDPLPNECLRCHVGHGSPDPSLVDVNSSVSCTTCHAAAYGGTYYGAATFNASAHSPVKCTSCHGSHGTASGPNGIYGFMLADTRQEVCFSCHATTKAAFDASASPAAEFAKHDIYPPEQAKTGSRIRCGNCHSVHSATGLVNPDTMYAPYETYRDDPTSIPTQEIVIYASRDTLLESAPGLEAYNYGASSPVTVSSSSRALFYFDLSSIPAGSTVQNATLVLWQSAPPAGGYRVYPVSRDWVEGTGAGALNSAGVNGATWFEWQYGDNANTGNVAGGDWAVVGGDFGAVAASNGSTGSNNAVNVTALVNTLRQGPNYGIMVGSYDASTSFPMYMREDAAPKYRPKLRIWVQTGPATRQVVDDVTYCLKCHDGTMPMGLRGQSLLNIAAAYSSRPHGTAAGLGPESRTTSQDAGGGGLKAPFSYGMGPLPCTTCHDPHGSRLPFHLKETVNGRDMAPLATASWSYGEVVRSAMGMASIPSAGWFCGACHIYPTNHNREGSSGCAPCHGHSGSRGG